MLTIIGLIVVVAAVLAIAATKPAAFEVKRTTRIEAPPEKIFPLINDFHKWKVWSPYEKLDPNMTRSYSGAESGVGAGYSWQGTKAGVGSMLITESTPSSKIAIDLKFTKPIQADNITSFTMEPEGGPTTVTWRMSGSYNFMAKVMGVFMNMDQMVGKDFEAGLANLKAAAEQ